MFALKEMSTHTHTHTLSLSLSVLTRLPLVQPEFDDEMRSYMKAMRAQRAQAELVRIA